MKKTAHEKPRHLVQVYGIDGSGLYVDGKLVSEYLTCGESRIVQALGFKNWATRRLNQSWYDSIVTLPVNLTDCVFANY
jgi:hypothetical protein